MLDIPPQPLTGKALLQKVEALSHLPRRETAKRCGYVTMTKTNKLRVNLNEFYDAVLAAKGLSLSPTAKRDRRGREPTFRVSVHKNGQIIIGSAYTEKMNLKPGDEFEIQLGYKHIHLKQVLNGQVMEDSTSNEEAAPKKTRSRRKKTTGA
ncbi:AbrB family transcriptional regulator [Synechococcus sp. 63AY4M2]|jgi:AbrB family looped-hinge helix DNA binding protein|uniref:AbrB family transcriptional regulator n=1 Tax=unclassified Synechococcus TaxID=2626047 RepID=UPI00006946D5|nr:MULTISPECIES: AbrB family transcriptional regulator [unclassified Synechococcus]ABD00335.1 transcriptional regulator, AbrB family [Synechococcus sp. JA-3-3Ab]PIK86808.1 AbrB family transcriptional regulator [Synechococcus sp. 63AY4M2]PIK87721.1 AbrB family transcriptional regulator [Synechococcus sp. 65AY6A5]PIK92164.1 AbrB family transcriptional regulator [Synechococcus sp. 65AY6Li]PIK95877.1 AbrB family transcriptional regulator [Synechococcus sp. 60AY4M2]